MNWFESDTLSALDAKEKAQWIAFAPSVFQATRVLRNTGLLAEVEKHPEGISLADLTKASALSPYGVRVLMEAALGIGLARQDGERYFLTKTAFFILHDPLTTVNLDFMHDVCYQGMFYLEDSIRTGRPEGLSVFGEWPTIYEGLSRLPAPVQRSWFAFDHYYSDVSFPEALPRVFENKPRTLLDIGGNTGKWTLQCLRHDPAVSITIMDLPGQVEMAKKTIASNGFGSRVAFHEADLLDETSSMPGTFDAIWMSQFLDCFSDDQIKSILGRCAGALGEAGKVYILEPFWDRQRFRAAAFSLQQTSLYFTAMANGNSQMYHSENFIRLISEAGLTVTAQHDGIGVSHTLLVCEPTGRSSR